VKDTLKDQMIRGGKNTGGGAALNEVMNSPWTLSTARRKKKRTTGIRGTSKRTKGVDEGGGKPMRTNQTNLYGDRLHLAARRIGDRKRKSGRAGEIRLVRKRDGKIARFLSE